MRAWAGRHRAIAWWVWLVASLFYAYQYVLRVMPNIVLEDIMKQFHLSAAMFGQFSGVYYIGYALMHIPVGIMLDRYGPRMVMTLSVLCTILGLLPLVFAQHWLYPILGRALIGMGSSAAILGTFKVIRLRFPEKQFSRMLSFAVMVGLVGAIYGGEPIREMRIHLGYQTVIQLLVAVGVVLAFITYWALPRTKSVTNSRILADMGEVFSNKKVVLSSVFAGCMVGPMEGFADVWSSAFLCNVYGMEGAVAASLPSLVFIGMCFGAPFLSLLAEKTRQYLLVIAGSGLCMAVCFGILLQFVCTPALISALFLLVGTCCGYQILVIYKATTYVRESVVGLTAAVANMIIMIFGYAFHSIIGFFVHALGGADSAPALRGALVVIPVTLLVGVLGFGFLYAKEIKQRVFSS